MEKHVAYLAADAGGSKTTWVLLNNTGEKIAECLTEGLGAARAGILPVRETVEKAAEALSQYGIPAGIFLSLGGPNVEEVREALENAWPGVAVTVEREACGDAILYAASFLGCSAVVMCGTGSTAVGDTDDGRRFCGGWGPIYGDGGSGGGMGSDALKLFLRSLDGQEECNGIASLFNDLTKDLAIEVFAERMEVKTRALNMSRRELAALAPKIYTLAEQGDQTALNLYRKAAEEIASMSISVSTDRPDFRILLCGGFFKNKPMLMDECKKIFTKMSSAKLYYEEKFSPIIAAEIAVLKNNGIMITEETIKKILG